MAVVVASVGSSIGGSSKGSADYGSRDYGLRGYGFVRIAEWVRIGRGYGFRG